MNLSITPNLTTNYNTRNNAVQNPAFKAKYEIIKDGNYLSKKVETVARKMLKDFGKDKDEIKLVIERPEIKEHNFGDCGGYQSTELPVIFSAFYKGKLQKPNYLTVDISRVHGDNWNDYGEPQNHPLIGVLKDYLKSLK